MIFNFNTLKIERDNSFTKKYWLRLCGDKAALLYIAIFYNDNESFIKVGITCSSIEERFSYIPYKYNLLYAEYGSPIKIYNLENKLHSILSSFSYLPKLMFSGHSECYNNECVNTIKKTLSINVDINEL